MEVEKKSHGLQSATKKCNRNAPEVVTTSKYEAQKLNRVTNCLEIMYLLSLLREYYQTK